MLPPPPTPPLFPYPTLFRSHRGREHADGKCNRRIVECGPRGIGDESGDVSHRGPEKAVLIAGPTASGKSDRKSTRLNSSHMSISYAVFCLKKKKKKDNSHQT